MAVVKTIKNGSGEIRIHDDYSKNKTQEEIQEIIDSVSLTILNFYRRETA